MYVYHNQFSILRYVKIIKIQEMWSFR